MRPASVWVKETIPLPQFQWQEGYGAYNVSASQRERVRDYIANQEAHHGKRTFRDELVELFHKAGVEYEGNYVD